MNEKGGRAERMFSSVMKGRWPEAEVVPDIAGPSAAAFGNRVEVTQDLWPREKLVMRSKGSNLGRRPAREDLPVGLRARGFPWLLPRLQQQQPLLRVAPPLTFTRPRVLARAQARKIHRAWSQATPSPSGSSEAL